VRQQKKRKSRSETVTFETVRELASTLPGVEEGTSYGTAALRVKSKFMARLREDGDSVAFRVGFDEREILMRAKPDIFFLTDHYRPYPAVLLRLSTATRHEVADIVELSWRCVAPKRLIAQFDSESRGR
jgi:hypothetical protein